MYATNIKLNHPKTHHPRHNLHLGKTTARSSDDTVDAGSLINPFIPGTKAETSKTFQLLQIREDLIQSNLHKVFSTD